MGLVARELEKSGISTVMVTLLPETTLALGVPRSLHFSRKLGNPIGRPNQKEEQYSALLQCLDVLNKAKKGEMITGTSEKS